MCVRCLYVTSCERRSEDNLQELGSLLPSCGFLGIEFRFSDLGASGLTCIDILLFIFFLIYVFVFSFFRTSWLGSRTLNLSPAVLLT